MRIQVIARNLGLVLLVNAAFMFLSIIVSAVNGFDTGFSPLVFSVIITATIGAFPFIFVRKPSSIATQEGYLIVLLSWIFSCFFGMLPYLLWGSAFSPINAWFESVSGYTTSGGTILTNIEALPKSLLFWRASTHFIGGMGVVMFLLLVLPEGGALRFRLSKIELSTLSSSHYRFRTNDTLRIISYVYFGMTLIVTLLLYMAGMSFFDAVCHAFSCVATGGFSTRTLSIAYYNNVWIEIILAVFMCFSAMHYGLIYLFVTGRSNALWRSPVTRFFLVSIGVASVLVTLSLWISGTCPHLGTALREGVFQVVSFATTTGFATANSAQWPLFSIIILLYLMLQCGCAGSTSGGIKVDRVVISIRSVQAQLTKMLHPKSVVPVRVGGNVVEPQTVTMVNMFIVLYALTAFVTVLLLSLCNVPFLEATTSAISSLSNIGPAFGSVGGMDNFAAFNGLAKFVLAGAMIVGRIELFGFFFIFSSRR